VWSPKLGLWIAIGCSIIITFIVDAVFYWNKMAPKQKRVGAERGRGGNSARHYYPRMVLF